MNMPPPPQDVQNDRNMINARIQGSHNVFDARESVRERSPTGSPGVDKKSGRRREIFFDPSSIKGGKRRTRKQKRSGKKSKTSKKRSGKKSKTSKKRGSRKRA
tara:strand:+ start:497 stop:805 length:309 start_codon:yes stop_codon:yes gene_type:complete